MKPMTVKEVKNLDMSSTELKVKEIQKELTTLMLQKSTSGIEKPHLIQVYKKNISRLNWWLSEVKKNG